jgi:hypothetical protein
MGLFTKKPKDEKSKKKDSKKLEKSEEEACEFC